MSFVTPLAGPQLLDSGCSAQAFPSRNIEIPVSNRPEKPRTPPVKQNASRTAITWWRRPLRATVFFGVPALLLLILVAVGYPMMVEARRETPQRISARRLAEFQQKKKVLAEASTLRKAGRYAKSIEVYDAYLKRYPYSTVARNGRAVARAALERSEPGSTRTASMKPAPSSDRDKPSLRSRMRRIFRRDRS